MKNHILLSLFSAFLMASCSEAELKIESFSVGDSDKKAHIGQSLDIKGVILAKEDLDSIIVHVRPLSKTGWTTKVLVEQSELHQHKGGKVDFVYRLNIPDTVSVGEYEILMSVFCDKMMVDKFVTIARSVNFVVDSTFPTVSTLDVGLNKAGNDLHVEADITAIKRIGSVSLVIEGASWSKTYDYDQDNLIGKLSGNFHKHVNVEELPQGDYHVSLRIKDEEGREVNNSTQFTKK